MASNLMSFVLLMCVAPYFMLTEAQQCEYDGLMQENFDPEKFSGDWYPGLMSSVVSCMFENFSVNFIWSPDDGNKIVVTTTFKLINLTLSDTAEWDTEYGDANFTVNFGGSLNAFFPGTYIVTCTDYETYAIIQGCAKYFPDALYILYRDEHPGATTVEETRAKLNECAGNASLVADRNRIFE